MQRIWATAATVWAVLGVTAALAWTQASHVDTTPAAVTPTVSTASAGSTAATKQVATISAPAHTTTRTS
jgi:hypothetical protein